MTDSKRQLKVLEMIIEDMPKDAKEADGKPFNGKTLGEIHGQLCATIATLAEILKTHIKGSIHD